MGWMKTFSSHTIFLWILKLLGVLGCTPSLTKLYETWLRLKRTVWLSYCLRVGMVYPHFNSQIRGWSPAGQFKRESWCQKYYTRWELCDGQAGCIPYFPLNRNSEAESRYSLIPLTNSCDTLGTLIALESKWSANPKLCPQETQDLLGNKGK